MFNLAPERLIYNLDISCVAYDLTRDVRGNFSLWLCNPISCIYFFLSFSKLQNTNLRDFEGDLIYIIGKRNPNIDL